MWRFTMVATPTTKFINKKKEIKVGVIYSDKFLQIKIKLIHLIIHLFWSFAIKTETSALWLNLNTFLFKIRSSFSLALFTFSTLFSDSAYNSICFYISANCKNSRILFSFGFGLEFISGKINDALLRSNTPEPSLISSTEMCFSIFSCCCFAI